MIAPTLSLALCLCLLFGCSTKIGPSEYAMVDLPDGLKRIEVERVGSVRGIRAGETQAIYVVRGLDSYDQEVSAYAQIRGSPISSASSGKIVAVIDGAFGDSRSTLCRASSSESIERVWRRARGLSAVDVDRWISASIGDADLEPGSAVWLLTAWGDINVGVQGTVAAIEGKDLCVLVEPGKAGALPQSGFCRAALAKAVVEAIDSHDGFRIERRCSVGPVVGGVYWSGPVVSAARLGVIPENVLFEVEFVGNGLRDVRSFRTVSDQSLGLSAASAALFRMLISRDISNAREMWLDVSWESGHDRRGPYATGASALSVGLIRSELVTMTKRALAATATDIRVGVRWSSR